MNQLDQIDQYLRQAQGLGINSPYIGQAREGIQMARGAANAVNRLKRTMYDPTNNPFYNGGTGLLTPRKSSPGYKTTKKIKSKPRSAKSRGSRAGIGRIEPGVIQRSAARAAMKKTGRSNVKKRKNVKVSKVFKKKVKQVIDDDKAYGEYRITKSGLIGVLVSRSGSADGEAESEILGYGDQAIVLGHRPGDYKVNSQCWWNGMLTRGDVPSFEIPYGNGNVVSKGDDWNFFTPMKFLDAASVLWADKLIRKDYSNIAGNLKSSVADTDPTLEFSQTNGMKFFIENSFVTFQIKNNTKRCMRMRFWHFQPKVAYPDKAPLESLRDSIAVHADENKVRFNGAAYRLYEDPAFVPSMLEGIHKEWTFEKIDVKIAPGETCKHSVQGPKNVEYNANKLYLSDKDNYSKMKKGWSVGVCCAVLPDLEMGVETGNALFGRPISGITLDNTYEIKLPLNIEIKEYYKMRVPNQKTFIQQAAIGEVQAENLNRKVYAFQNAANEYSLADGMEYTAFDEENPAADIPAGTRN